MDHRSIVFVHEGASVAALHVIGAVVVQSRLHGVLGQRYGFLVTEFNDLLPNRSWNLAANNRFPHSSTRSHR